MHFLIDLPDITNPALNLALEEFAIRNLDVENDYFFCYSNEPSVIIGKHQNVFEEVNTDFLQRKAIPVYRRISGGGAVYHDMGNLNFSFITKFSKSDFNNYQKFTRPVIKTLNQLGVPAKLNRQNAIVIGDEKISGNAQFTSKDRLMSHGTLLYNCDLKNLRDVLAVKQKAIRSKSRKSIRSRVTNLSDFLLKKISLEELKNLLISNIFKSEEKILFYRFRDSEWKAIRRLAREKYESWDWNYGESPKFSVSISHLFPKGMRHLQIDVEKGKISVVEINGEDLPAAQVRLFQSKLQGVRYGWKDLLAVLYQIDLKPFFGDVTAEGFLDLIF